MELISVIVVTYNSSKTVIETLESIKNQTYPTLELIITDDCSTDNTIKLIKEWLYKNHKRFFNVRILSARKNHGVTKNCNIGIFQAKGKYIQLVAGDDILLEQAVERKYQFAEQNFADIVVSKIEPFGVNIFRVNEMKRRCENNYQIIKKGWKEQYNNIIDYNIVIGPSGGFYRTQYIKDIGGYDVRYPMLEDWPFILRYIAKGNELVLLDETLTKYRVSDTSLSSAMSASFSKDELKFFVFERLGKMIHKGKLKEALEELNMWTSQLLRKRAK